MGAAAGRGEGAQARVSQAVETPRTSMRPLRVDETRVEALVNLAGELLLRKMVSRI